ncbi:hypothetical protein [Aliikangiella maris]|uniref:Uncharacterized protein n=2 Tax=Aliikangiella maris TaxID=3162458 RepID=A0ABV2BXT2_9GAMM
MSKTESSCSKILFCTIAAFIILGLYSPIGKTHSSVMPNFDYKTTYPLFNYTDSLTIQSEKAEKYQQVVSYQAQSNPLAVEKLKHRITLLFKKYQDKIYRFEDRSSYFTIDPRLRVKLGVDLNFSGIIIPSSETRIVNVSRRYIGEIVEGGNINVSSDSQVFYRDFLVSIQFETTEFVETKRIVKRHSLALGKSLKLNFYRDNIFYNVKRESVLVEGLAETFANYRIYQAELLDNTLRKRNSFRSAVNQK